MTDTGWFVGVEADASRTRAVALDAGGAELARVDGPGAFTDADDPNAAAGPILDLVRVCAWQAGRKVPAKRLWAAISGTTRGTVLGSISLVLERGEIADRVNVSPFSEAAFYEFFGEGPGILLVAGTGSEGRGRNPSGGEARVGGWGSLVGDEGSGYAIGQESLRRIARDADGRGPETRLRDAILAHLGLDSLDDLVQWASLAPKREIASLTGVVVESSRRGDAVAGEILLKSVEELVGHVRALLHNLGPWHGAPSVALSGWLLRKGAPLRRAMEIALADEAVNVVDRDPDAALGAARLALVAGR